MLLVPLPVNNVGKNDWSERIYMNDNFLLGCNYWASHAGIRMWEDWSADEVEQDFCSLSDIGCNCIRIFPLWSVFQPIKQLYTYKGVERQIRYFGEEPLTADGSGIDEVMVSRLRIVLALAEKYHFKVIISLINGWMSGRLFVPAALEGKNIITDASAIYWQVKYVRGMVERLKDCLAVYAWEPGNECNCMAQAGTRYEAYNWANVVANAIRTADQTRPVFSGMHGLACDSRIYGPQSESAWLIRDQAELTDMLTVHPYPAFMPYCACDPISEMKPLLYGTAEGVLYRDIGGKSCLVEEAGTLGPMNASDDLSEQVAGASIFSAFVHGLKGYLWWCAFDCNFDYPPYDWYEVERELGAFHGDRSPKPVTGALKKFSEKLKMLGTLPPYRTNAVCLIANPMKEPFRDDAWRNALGAFVLSKQAGFDLSFADANGDIPEAELYLLPSLRELSVLHSSFAKILQRVERGAALYISLDDAVIADFRNIFGLEIVARFKDAAEHIVEYANDRIPVDSSVKYKVAPVGCEVIATEKGMPVYCKKTYGKGTIFLLLYPIEKEAAKKSGVGTPEGFTNISALYKPFMNAGKRLCVKDNPFVGITEHIGEKATFVAAINYSSLEQTVRLQFMSSEQPVLDKLSDACSIKEEEDKFVLKLPPCGTALLRL